MKAKDRESQINSLKVELFKKSDDLSKSEIERKTLNSKLLKVKEENTKLTYDKNWFETEYDRLRKSSNYSNLEKSFGRELNHQKNKLSAAKDEIKSLKVTRDRLLDSEKSQRK